MTVSDEEAKDVRTAPGHARPQPETPTGPLGGDPALIPLGQTDVRHPV
jgi:hypothetical protein